jgi:cysteine-rich repeat protein
MPDPQLLRITADLAPRVNLALQQNHVPFFRSRGCMFAGQPMENVTCNADNSVCTPNDLCKSGTCFAGALMSCEDNNLCTNDGCSPTAGCTHQANMAVCNDNNLCTGPDACAGGTCSPPLLTCNDNNVCTTDTCNGASGCVNQVLANGSVCSPTAYCLNGTCTPGKCGDGIKTPALGEQCDDGNTVNGDGCHSNCAIEDAACSDGTRDGSITPDVYPGMAMCGGSWTGWIGATGPGTAGALCGTGWHVCTFTDTTTLKSVSADIAFGPGCWALNAANHGSLCEACGQNQNRDMAGFGQQCGGGIVNSGTSCISNTYKINASSDTCVRTANNLPWVTGVMCCKN